MGLSDECLSDTVSFSSGVPGLLSSCSEDSWGGQSTPRFSSACSDSYFSASEPEGPVSWLTASVAAAMCACPGIVRDPDVPPTGHSLKFGATFRWSYDPSYFSAPPDQRLPLRPRKRRRGSPSAASVRGHKSRPGGLYPPELWIVDSGCGYDLIGMQDIAEEDRHRLIRAAESLVLHSARGDAPCSHRLPFDLECLRGGEAEPYVMKSSPPVLSLGLRCRHEGFEFYWPKYRNPILTFPNGKKVELEVYGDIPYLREWGKRPSMPATPAPAAPLVAPGAGLGAAQSEPVAAPAGPSPASEADVDEPIPLVCLPCSSSGSSAPASVYAGDSDSEKEPLEVARDLGLDIQEWLSSGSSSRPPQGGEQPLPEQPAENRSSEYKKRMIEIANSWEHCRTHLPKNPWCPACQIGKLYHQRKPNRSKESPSEDPEEELPFGSKTTADYLIARGEKSKGFDGAEAALVMLDLGTRWREIAPTAKRNTFESVKALQHFAGPKTEIHSFYSDSGRELVSAAEHLSWCHVTSVPYIHHTNGIVEREVRHVEEGTKTMLVRAGLDPKWWPLASKYFCMALDIEVDHELG